MATGYLFGMVATEVRFIAMKLFTSVVFRLVLTVLAFNFLLRGMVFAQSSSSSPSIEVGIDKGIRFNAPDSSLGLRIGFRLQTQLYSTISLEEEQYATEQTQTRTMIRRARMLLMGYLLQDEFTYFLNIQFDKGKSDISDAILCWHPNANHTFGVGQFRVFDDRQFRISSAYLQFVERSVVSNEFTQGYDIGAYWNGSWMSPDNLGLNLYLSATHGEWKNKPTQAGGFLFTGRAELLPLGAFSGKGDYRGGGLYPQPDPRLSIGIAASLNNDAHLNYGSSNEPGVTDITSLFGDFLFRYRHFSLLGEVAWRDLEQEQWLLPDGGQVLPKLYSGYGAFVQAGTLVSSNVEINGRFEMLHPENDSDLERRFYNCEERYSLGVTRYIHKHNLKIQAMITLADKYQGGLKEHERYLESRLQMQVNF